MAEHTPTPWWYQEKSDSYTHILRSGENRFVCQFGSEVTARRVNACVNAFHDPNRSIATEHISKGLVWRMYGMLEDFMYAAGSTERARAFAAAQEFIASLKVQSDG